MAEPEPSVDVNAEQEVALTVRGPDGRDWHLSVLIIVAVLALVAAGLTVGYTMTQREAQVNRAEAAVQANRDVLVALCSSLTTLRFVFEQLELLDRRITRDETLSPATRANVRARATLYATAVVALSNGKECRGIE